MKYKTLSTEDNYKKNLNKENGKQKVSETETEPFNQLVTADQIRVNKFMQNHLLLPKEGVIKSAWRAKQEHQMKKEAIKSRVSMYNDALGNGAREF